MSSKCIVALFMGPPGAGKGTLSAYCKKELGWYQLSTGDLLRQHILEQTELGKQIDFIIKSGKLVSDELINSMVGQWLKDLCAYGPKGVILDGYPRTIAQAQALTSLLEESLGNISLNVVRLQVNEQTASARIATRIVCENSECQAVYSVMSNSSMKPQEDMVCDKCNGSIGKRKDDQESSIGDRLAIYSKHEENLLNFYSELGLSVINCDAEQSIQGLFSEFKNLMNIHSI